MKKPSPNPDEVTLNKNEEKYRWELKQYGLVKAWITFEAVRACPAHLNYWLKFHNFTGLPPSEEK